MIVPEGGVKATLIVVELVTVATTPVGEASMVVTELDAVDDADVPPELTATTVNVYAVFAVNPLTITGEVVFVPVDTILPGLLVTI